MLPKEQKVFEKENPTVKFSINARPTVREQMEYFSVVAGEWNEKSLFRYWRGACILITDWKCDAIPDKDVNLDEIDNPEQTQIVIWVGTQVKAYMDRLETLPKN